MLSPADWSAIGVTVQLATVSTLALLLLGTPLAWWLAFGRFRFKVFVEAALAMPLILPPTVLGFYLLLFLGAEGPLSFIVDGGLAFSFTGLVIGSIVYSLPFVVQPLQNAFLSMGRKPLEAAACLGASPWNRFIFLALPQARAGLLTASILGFAHTVGEFGVVLMIGGNIPGKTQVISIAIYDHVEALEYGHAHSLAGILLLFSFILLLLVYSFNRRYRLGPL